MTEFRSCNERWTCCWCYNDALRTSPNPCKNQDRVLQRQTHQKRKRTFLIAAKMWAKGQLPVYVSQTKVSFNNMITDSSFQLVCIRLVELKWLNFKVKILDVQSIGQQGFLNKSQLSSTSALQLWKRRQKLMITLNHKNLKSYTVFQVWMCS